MLHGFLVIDFECAPDFGEAQGTFPHSELRGQNLREALRRTFDRRGSELPAGDMPVALTAEFDNDANKKKLWAAFCTRNARYVRKTDLSEVIGSINRLLAPVVATFLEGTSFTKRWEPGGPWR
jgi:hypothetical protein